MYDMPLTYAPLPFRPQLLLAEAAAVYSVASQRLSRVPGFRLARQFGSYGFTALLFVVSVFGVVQLVQLASESSAPPATSHAVSAAPAPTKAPASSHKSPVAASPSLPASTPTHMQIPAINLDAAVDQVGLNTDGSLQVPYREDVGWYTGSPTPGQTGPAIIDGHVDSIYGIAVFWYLRNLKPGDRIMIARADGSTVNFEVDKTASYDQHNFPTNEVYGNINYPGLRLITCDGTFDYTTRHYSNNLVVYAHALL